MGDSFMQELPTGNKDMNTAKITIIGDIMCEPLLLRAAKSNGKYDFDGVFERMKTLFSESDYVIGNLEAPLAGKEAGYTHELFSFNAPDEFADAVKRAGISLVLTANNHCMDRGFDGLLRTVRTLDEKGIRHHGTFLSAEARIEATYFQAGESKIAVISYTSSDNYPLHRTELTKEQQECVNFLRPYRESPYNANPKQLGAIKKVISCLLRPLKNEQILWLKKLLGKPYKNAMVDDHLDESSVELYFERLKADIEAAREKADIVLFCPHMGGQFNKDPGRFAEYAVKKAAEYGADAVLASHPHVVQKAALVSGVPCFYSLGNFSMSPNSFYVPHENLPDYGLAVHLYTENGKIARTTFSILKIVETKERPLTVYPADQYLDGLADREEFERAKRNVFQVFTTVTGRQATDEELFLNGVAGENGSSALKQEFDLTGREGMAS